MGRSTTKTALARPSGSVPQNTDGRNQERKKGFHVGPDHAPRDAYLGKAKKIKADLILRAKMKKQYARVLKEEGMESTRLSDGPRRRGNIEDEAITEEQRDGKGKETSSASEEEGLERWEPREPTRTRARALSPSDIGPPMPQTSMRELKKQAFARYHSPRFESAARGAGGGVKGKGQPNMGARMGALLERIKRDKTG